MVGSERASKDLLLPETNNMSRMYSRKRGKAGSKKPLTTKKPSWTSLKPKEVETIIAKLKKEGKSAALIGLILRDSYGIPDVKLLLGKTITKVLEEKDLRPNIPEDLFSLIKKSVSLQKHRETNRQDQTSLRGLQLTESKIRRLTKYYKRTGRLPMDWKFDAESLRLYVQ